MAKNRILSVCCCLPILFNTATTLGMGNQNKNLKTPFIAEITNQNSRSINVVEFKSTTTLMNEQLEAYEIYKAEQEELERQRIEKEKEEARLAAIEEQRRLEEERQRIESNRVYCTFEVSFYTTAPDEGGGEGIGASGEYVQPWVSIALPRKTGDGRKIPFYSTATIEGLGTFINHDTGSYIQWTDDNVCRVDVCVSTKEEAYRLGRFLAEGYIDLNVEN